MQSLYLLLDCKSQRKKRSQCFSGVLGLTFSLLMCFDEWHTGIGNGETFKYKINYLQSDSIGKTQHVFYA